jgi:hypothetical protein
MKQSRKNCTAKKIHTASVIVILALISYGTNINLAEAVQVSFPSNRELTSIVENSREFKYYEGVLNRKEGEIDPVTGDYAQRIFGTYSKSYLEKNPSASSLVKEPFEDKMYCGDTTLYTISGESPSEFTGNLRDGKYANFWSGDWFHTFVHSLVMHSDSKDSEKNLFPSVPGWRLDGVWNAEGIEYNNKIQATQNSYQITRVEPSCYDKGKCTLITALHDLDSKRPVGIGSDLLNRLRIDVTWLNGVEYLPLTRKALVVGLGMGADVAYQVSKELDSNDVKFIYVDPYKLPKNTPGVIRWNKPSLDFADFRLNKNLFSGKITSSSRAKSQATELYNAIKKVVDENAAKRDPRCDDYAKLSNVSIASVFIDKALNREEPLVTMPLLEGHNEFMAWPKGQLAMYDPKIGPDKTRFTTKESSTPVAEETVYKDSTVNVVSGYLDDLFEKSTQTGMGRSTDGRLHFTSYGSANDSTPDSNTKQARGNHNNLLVLGSVALSPNLIRQYGPAFGAEVLVNDVHIGYYDDSSASTYKGSSIVNTIDIYDPANKYNDKLFRVIPAGKWTLSFGPVRAQTPNIPGKKNNPPKDKSSETTKPAETNKPSDKDTTGSETNKNTLPLPTGREKLEASTGNPLLPPAGQLPPGVAGTGGGAGDRGNSGSSNKTNTNNSKNSGKNVIIVKPKLTNTSVGKLLDTRTTEEVAAIKQQDDVRVAEEKIRSNFSTTTKSEEQGFFSKLMSPFKTLYKILF